MLEDTPVWQTYVADGVQKQWNFTLPYVESTSIKLYISHDGELTKISPSLYTFDPTTNVLTYPIDASPAAPAGDIILLWRETDLTQEEDSTHVAFKSNDIELMVDKLTAICQELADKQGRSISYDPAQESSGEETNAAEYIQLLEDYKIAAETAATNSANSATASADSATAANNSKVAAAGSATSASNSAATATNKATAASSSASAASLSATSAQGYATEAYNNAKKFIAMPVGSIYFSGSNLIDDNPAAYKAWTGQTIQAADQACPALWNFVIRNQYLQTTQANYNNMVNNYGGCPLYIIDTTAKTLVLPKIQTFIKASNGASPSGSVDSQLPITGTLRTQYKTFFGGPIATGAFKINETYREGWTSTSSHGENELRELGFDSGLLGDKYNGTEVKPKHITLFPWLVYRDTIDDLISHNGGTIIVKTYTVQEWAETDPKPRNTLCLIDEDDQ